MVTIIGWVLYAGSRRAPVCKAGFHEVQSYKRRTIPERYAEVIPLFVRKLGYVGSIQNTFERLCQSVRVDFEGARTADVPARIQISVFCVDLL